MSSRRYAPLEDYGLVGDGRSAALVGRDGSVDWWCPPRFDAPSVFARLLDDRTGGFCSLAPAGAVRASPMWESSQRYRPGTCVLVTEFRGADARLTVTDAMPWPGPGPAGDGRGAAAGPDVPDGPGDPVRPGSPDARGGGTPPTLIRRVAARGGPVEAELRFAPRFDYARAVPGYREAETGWTAAGADGELLALSPAPGQDLDLEVDGRRDEVSGRLRVEPGRPRWIVLRRAEGEPSTVSSPVSAEACRRALEETAETWRRRARDVPVPGGRGEGDGAHGGDRAFSDRAREGVVRSALTLDLLTHLPTGAVVGAATTSLPGAGPLRDGRALPRTAADATAVLAALTGLGRRREARRLCRCLARAGPGGRLRGDVPSEGNAGVAADGDDRTGDAGAGTEVELEHLHGHEGRRPARVLPSGPSAGEGAAGPGAGPGSAAPGGDGEGPRPLARQLEEARDLALEGRPAEAREAFETAAGRAGPTGLLAEAVDPEAGRLRGNVPSAAAHAALVNAARVIAAAEGEELRTTRRPSP